MNGDIPVVELIRELWVYSTQGRWVEQEAVRWGATHHSEDSKSWLTHSTWPLDCVWYPDVRLVVVPSAWQKALHTWEVN